MRPTLVTETKDYAAVLYLMRGLKAVDSKVFGPDTETAIMAFVEQVYRAYVGFKVEELSLAFGSGKFNQLSPTQKAKRESIPADVSAMWSSWCSQTKATVVS